MSRKRKRWSVSQRALELRLASSFDSSAGGFKFGAKKASSTTADHAFVPRGTSSLGPPANFGTVPVIITASGLILSAALDRNGSMNRFAGGWSG